MSKVWFVTGANSGFGTSIAKAALAAGDQVVATARNMDKLRADSLTPATTSRWSISTSQTRARLRLQSPKRSPGSVVSTSS
jgi:NADP-dependent 3-hydroxy acid dehydrogenase YdfG